MVELLTGDLLFPTHQNYEHVAMIEKLCGPIPKWMAERTSEEELLGKFLVNEGDDKKGESYFDWPKSAASKKSISRVDELATLSNLLGGSTSIHPVFGREKSDGKALLLLEDLISKCLTIDPRDRITCEKALTHPFFEI